MTRRYTRIIRRVGDAFDNGCIVGRIIRVWPLGTVDVEEADGRCYRVTGLPLITQDPRHQEETR